MFILRFLGRALFTLAVLVVLVVAFAGFLVLGALGLASLLFLAAAAFFVLAYAVRHTPDMAHAALAMLLSSLGCFVVLVGLEGVILDVCLAAWRRLSQQENRGLTLEPNVPQA